MHAFLLLLTMTMQLAHNYLQSSVHHICLVWFGLLLIIILYSVHFVTVCSASSGVLINSAIFSYPGLLLTLIPVPGKTRSEMSATKVITYLTVLTVNLVLAEHGGDEFKKWPVKPGGWVQATKGEVWPKPKVSKPQEEFLVLRSNSFRFEVRTRYLFIFCSKNLRNVNCKILKFES